MTSLKPLIDVLKTDNFSSSKLYIDKNLKVHSTSLGRLYVWFKGSENFSKSEVVTTIDQYFKDTMPKTKVSYAEAKNIKNNLTALKDRFLKNATVMEKVYINEVFERSVKGLSIDKVHTDDQGKNALKNELETLREDLVKSVKDLINTYNEDDRAELTAILDAEIDAFLKRDRKTGLKEVYEFKEELCKIALEELNNKPLESQILKSLKLDSANPTSFLPIDGKSINDRIVEWEKGRDANVKILDTFASSFTERGLANVLYAQMLPNHRKDKTPQDIEPAIRNGALPCCSSEQALRGAQKHLKAMHDASLEKYKRLNPMTKDLEKNKKAEKTIQTRVICELILEVKMTFKPEIAKVLINSLVLASTKKKELKELVNANGLRELEMIVNAADLRPNANLVVLDILQTSIQNIDVCNKETSITDTKKDELIQVLNKLDVPTSSNYAGALKLATYLEALNSKLSDDQARYVIDSAFKNIGHPLKKREDIVIPKDNLIGAVGWIGSLSAFESNPAVFAKAFHKELLKAVNLLPAKNDDGLNLLSLEEEQYNYSTESSDNSGSDADENNAEDIGFDAGGSFGLYSDNEEEPLERNN